MCADAILESSYNIIANGFIITCFFCLMFGGDKTYRLIITLGLIGTIAVMIFDATVRVITL